MWSCWNNEFCWFVGWRRVLLSVLAIGKKRSVVFVERAVLFHVSCLSAACVCFTVVCAASEKDIWTAARSAHWPALSVQIIDSKNRRNNYACLHSANSTADVVETFSQVAGKNAAQTFQNTCHWQEQKEDYQSGWSDQIRMARHIVKKNGITKVIMSRVREDHGWALYARHVGQEAFRFLEICVCVQGIVGPIMSVLSGIQLDGTTVRFTA